MASGIRVTVRAAHAGDEPRINALLTAAQLPLDGVHGALRDFVVAEENARIVGVAGFERCGDGGRALLRSVAVDAALQRSGIGNTLVARVIDEAAAAGITNLYLLTTTAADYFKARGFQPIDRESAPAEIRATAEFTTACPASAELMTRVL
jgi:N-acetylglutamate synthase-like GNAT family acetyltransferase